MGACPWATGGALTGLERVRTRSPEATGDGYCDHRMALEPDGLLHVTSGDRQLMAPARDPTTTRGEIVRLTPEGRPARGNPYAGRGGAAAEVRPPGHRDPLGVAFGARGRFWEQEMGPRGPDELDLIVGGANHGRPAVSEGRHCSGRAIPTHAGEPRATAPAAAGVPSVPPAGSAILRGERFPGRRGDGVPGTPSGEALIRVEFGAEDAREVERFSWGARVREVEEGPDGALRLLEDGSGGQLIHLTQG